MMLDQNDVQVLRRKFQPSEHEFRQDFVYITESAITNRIEEVDPSWVFEIVSVYTRDNQSIVNARLTIKGVSRDGVGMQVIMDKGTAEPEKGAATDALKRCARLFGIGRYLLDTPSGVKEMTSLTKWLNSMNSNSTSQNNGATNGNGSGHQNAGNSPLNAVSDVFDETTVKEFVAHYIEHIDMAGLLAALNVKRFGEWNKGKAAAYKAVDAALKGRVA